MTSTALPEPGVARRQRRTVAVVLMLGLASWFSATAVGPSIAADWDLGTTGLLWLTGSVQLGFVVGALSASLANLPDRVPSHLLAAACSGGAALTTVGFVLWADGLTSAVLIRGATGVLLAGIYPPAMRMTASWSPHELRGRAFGMLIACLTLGSALPHLLRAVDDLPWRAVMGGSAAASLIGGLLCLFLVRSGPLVERSQGLQVRHAFIGLRGGDSLRANLGYFGHMWELYAFWTWAPTLLVSLPTWELSASQVGLLTFLVIGLAGAFGCVAGGWIADRRGRRFTAVAALAISGGCCAFSPLLWRISPPFVLGVLILWGAAVIADSGVFSAALSETVDSRFVGTALAAQTAIGYLLTVLSIQLTGTFGDLLGWQWAFLPLVAGPVIAGIAMAGFGGPGSMNDRSKTSMTPWAMRSMHRWGIGS